MLAFVGCRNPQIGATFAQHSCFFKVDESVLVKGSMVAAQYAIDFLSEPTHEELDGPLVTVKGSMVAAQYAIDFLSEPTHEELDGPLVTRVAETNPQLAETLRGARSKTVGAHTALRDAREARVAAAREIREARHGSDTRNGK